MLKKHDAVFEYDLTSVQAAGRFNNLSINPAAYCKSASPAIAAMPMSVRKNQLFESAFPIYNSDEIDDFTPTTVSVGHGELIPSVKDRRLQLSYMQKKILRVKMKLF